MISQVTSDGASLLPICINPLHQFFPTLWLSCHNCRSFHILGHCPGGCACPNPGSVRELVLYVIVSSTMHNTELIVLGKFISYEIWSQLLYNQLHCLHRDSTFFYIINTIVDKYLSSGHSPLPLVCCFALHYLPTHLHSQGWDVMCSTGYMKLFHNIWLCVLFSIP